MSDVAVSEPSSFVLTAEQAAALSNGKPSCLPLGAIKIDHLHHSKTE